MRCSVMYSTDKKKTIGLVRGLLLTIVFVNATVADLRTENKLFTFLKTREGRRKARIAAGALLMLAFCLRLSLRSQRGTIVEKPQRKLKSHKPKNSSAQKQQRPLILQDEQAVLIFANEYTQLLEHILLATCLDTFSI